MAALMEHFQDMLKDIYYAEKQIYKTLPKIIRAVSDEELRSGFEKHRDETEGQIERLEQVFELMDMPARGKRCPAIDGILEEGAELIEEHDKGAGLDAALAAVGQAVEHYEIARYGTMCEWAKMLDLKDAKKLLGEILDQEEKCDQTLTALAESKLNEAALAADEDSDDEDMGSGRPAKAMRSAKPSSPSKSKASR